jgi:hypothetical protein
MQGTATGKIERGKIVVGKKNLKEKKWTFQL